jgi:hypothetical protein
MKAVLFDVDGTLANIDHRRPVLEEDPHNWKDFFSAMGDDTLNEHIADLYRLIWSSPEHECIIVSGRPEKYRELTEQWLTWNKISFDRLELRPTGDQREDSIVKKGILDMLVSEGKEIAFVVDDRRSVVDMWRKNGITCLQCADYDV